MTISVEMEDAAIKALEKIGATPSNGHGKIFITVMNNKIIDIKKHESVTLSIHKKT